MNKIAKFFLIATLLGFLACVTGCTEEKASCGTDMQARLIASENIDLKAQLKQKNKEIANQNKLLADCQKQLEDKNQEQGLGLMEAILKASEKK